MQAMQSLLHYSHRNKHFSLSAMIQLPRVCGGYQPVGIRDDIPTCSGGSKLTELHQLFVESVPPTSDKCQKKYKAKYLLICLYKVMSD